MSIKVPKEEYFQIAHTCLWCEFNIEAILTPLFGYCSAPCSTDFTSQLLRQIFIHISSPLEMR
jgi:hypothetical protein